MSLASAIDPEKTEQKRNLLDSLKKEKIFICVI